MANLENTILNITEKTITIDEMAIPESDASDFGGIHLPLIKINGYEFDIKELGSFELNLTSFLPTIRVNVQDKSMNFMSRFFPRDGDVINFLIRSNNEEVFKQIRIDFDILSVSPQFRDKSSKLPTLFTIYGQMKVPNLLTEFCESYDMSSYDLFLEISQKLELGFATNEENTNDKMKWINPLDTTIKFLKDSLSNVYKDDTSFFTSYIDSYYNLCFININKQFSIDSEITESEIYRVNDARYTVSPDELKKDIQKAPLMLTNHVTFEGTSKYITDYQMFNNSGTIFLMNGYKRYAQFFEVDGDQYVSEFVDPLTTEGSENMVHLKGRLIKQGDNFVPEGVSDTHVKYKYLGKQDSRTDGNVHENFKYSEVLNFQNKTEIFKMGMNIVLESADMTLTKFQSVPIFIFNYEETAKSIQKEETVNSLDKTPLKNDFLSGDYVIADITYFYNFPGPIKQRLTLLKREYIASI